MTQIQNQEQETHDPTHCEDCHNTGYVTRYIDRGRLIADEPCGCPQSEQSEHAAADPMEGRMTTGGDVHEVEYARRDVRVTYSRAAQIDIAVALLDAINKWYAMRRIKGPQHEYGQYCRQRCREYVESYRQHTNPTRREYL